jgi:hypothetical protein
MADDAMADPIFLKIGPRNEAHPDIGAKRDINRERKNGLSHQNRE